MSNDKNTEECKKCMLRNDGEQIYLTPTGRISRALLDQSKDKCYPFEGGMGFCELHHLGEEGDQSYYESGNPEGRILEFKKDYYLTIHPCWGACIMRKLSLWTTRNYPANLDAENARVWLEDLKMKKFGKFEYGNGKDKTRYIPADKVVEMEKLNATKKGSKKK